MVKFILTLVALVVVGFWFKSEPTLLSKVLSSISVVVGILIGMIKVP